MLACLGSWAHLTAERPDAVRAPVEELVEVERAEASEQRSGRRAGRRRGRCALLQPALHLFSLELVNPCSLSTSPGPAPVPPSASLLLACLGISLRLSRWGSSAAGAALLRWASSLPPAALADPPGPGWPLCCQHFLAASPVLLLVPPSQAWVAQ
uniref:Uncharacterized protein n=1 Tax=Sphaerodactylus townsendi TaxID=933632 RepID=A0ACB8F9A0_9SAUR